MNKIGAFLFGMMALSYIAAATTSTGIERVGNAISQLCGSLTSLLPVASMLMVVVAGVIYAAGQVMGAETRARANVWATAALTGALIGVLIFAVAPSVLNTIYGGDTPVECTYTP